MLVITGARQAGVAGPGTFISNGGTLRLDTVLNEGGAATRSDTLVVDGTSVGAGGATNMAIRNAGGAGALTVGDGILVVQVLEPSPLRSRRVFAQRRLHHRRRVRLSSLPGRPQSPAIPAIGSCARTSCAGWACRSGRRRRSIRRCRSIRRRRCCRRASFRSSGRRSRPTAWSSRSPGNWG